MTDGPSPWLGRFGWTLAIALAVTFVWGLDRRARLEEGARESTIRMLFVPSVEQGTMVRRGDELARFIREDSGLVLVSEVPTSYAAVIQAMGAGHADVAWMPAFAYVMAHERAGARARLQVVRDSQVHGILVVRAGEEDALPAAGAGAVVAIPADLPDELRARVAAHLDEVAPGWTAVEVATDRDAVRALVDRDRGVRAAASTWVFSGPFDLVGDGRKELEAERPGTLDATAIAWKTSEPVSQEDAHYYGCVLTRTDSGIRRLEDLNGRAFAFSDETSTSGHIFPKMLLDRAGVVLGRAYMAGGHPNVVQAVWDGKAEAGSTFWSPPGKNQQETGTLVGDARWLISRRFQTDQERVDFLDEVRVIARTDPIPNDVCVTRGGLDEDLWRRFEASLQRFLRTPAGREAYFDLVAGIAAAPVDDSAFDGFRSALRVSGTQVDELLKAAEAQLEQKRGAKASTGSAK